jgi:hypothetical protein
LILLMHIFHKRLVVALYMIKLMNPRRMFSAIINYSVVPMRRNLVVTFRRYSRRYPPVKACSF